MTQLSIKNMVCPRCVMAVTSVLQSLGYNVAQVNIGNATVTDDLTASQLDTLDAHLRKIGFELLRNEDDALVERIKTAVIFLSRRDDGEPVKLSEELSRALKTD